MHREINRTEWKLEEPHWIVEGDGKIRNKKESSSPVNRFTSARSIKSSVKDECDYQEFKQKVFRLT